MHASVLAILCLSLTCASLRQPTQPDLFQSFELLNQLFEQAFYTATQSLELQILTLLYSDNGADIQTQLDECEANGITESNAALQTLSAGVMGLGTACSSDDPSAPVSALIQATLQRMAEAAAPCDALPVDLLADIEEFIATAIVQGYEFGLLWTGPLSAWTAIAVKPIAGTAQYLQPLADTAVSATSSLGVTDETISKTTTDVAAIQSAWTTVLNDIAAGTVTSNDVFEALNAGLVLSNDSGAVFEDVVQGAAQYSSQAVGVICSIVGPLLEVEQ